MPDFYWVQTSWGSVPHNAVTAGRDTDGSILYVGRAFHEGDVLPAKVSPSRKGAFVSWAGAEHSKFTFEEDYEKARDCDVAKFMKPMTYSVKWGQVLCGGPGAWMVASNGQIPKHAVPGGVTAGGETLYIGRVLHLGSLTPGKVYPSHRVCYISYGGQEIRFPQYEVLVKS